MDQNRRTDDRLPVLWRATITDAQDKTYDAEIRDISHAGILLSSHANFDIDTDILVEIENLGDFAGRVKWQGQNMLGLMLIAGDDLALKKFAEAAGSKLSQTPVKLADGL